jgi:CRP-like cAMP-binding protein
LSAEDKALLTAFVRRPRNVPAGIALPVPARGLGAMVVAGCAARVRLFVDGRRQITRLILTGELFDCDVNPFESDTPIALTDVKIVDLAPLTDALARSPDDHPQLRKAFALAANLKTAQMIEQIVSLGARPALERVAYWILETHYRLTLTIARTGDSCPLPFTQEMIGDICGISVVHVNRVFKSLRQEKLASVHAGRVVILDADRLRMIAEYEPLHLQAGQARHKGNGFYAHQASIAY